MLIEIKLSHEPIEERASRRIQPSFACCSSICPDLTALELRGLMTVPPYLEDLAAVRPYFAQLRKSARSAGGGASAAVVR